MEFMTRPSVPAIAAPISLRLAVMADIPRISDVMRASIEELQAGYLSPDQIIASAKGMGLDTQLIEDGTYFCAVAQIDGAEQIVGCGGWSFRATLYGGNHSGGRDLRRLDPKNERARIRAMYTHPNFVRRGIGRLILQASEDAAREAGFRALEMAATLAGEPFYLRCGYTVKRRWLDSNSDLAVPLLTMVKTFSPAAQETPSI